MIRRLFTIVAAFSLLLCVAAVVIWLAMPWGYRSRFHTSHHRYEFQKWRDAVSLEIMGGILWPDGAFRAPPGKRWNTNWQVTHQLPLGVVVGHSPASDPSAALYFRIFVPLWLLVVATGLLPLLWLSPAMRRLRRTRQEPLGLCPRCGYDLRASKDRCPECGAVFTIGAGGSAGDAQA